MPAWDLVGLAALDVADRLFADSGVVVHAAEPGKDEHATGRAVRDLATALAAWCSRRASSSTLSLPERVGP